MRSIGTRKKKLELMRKDIEARVAEFRQGRNIPLLTLAQTIQLKSEVQMQYSQVDKKEFT